MIQFVFSNPVKGLYRSSHTNYYIYKYQRIAIIQIF